VTESDQQSLIEQIHASGHRLVLSSTGGGSGAIAALLEVPGASASVLEAIVPYAATALEQWLGGAVEQHCSERTARAMAMAGFERTRELADADPHTLRGIGATASLATTRPKLGPHRIHVAWQSANTTAVASLELSKGQHSRSEEERLATHLILDAVGEACGITARPRLEESLCDQVRRRRKQAPASWTELLLGRRATVSIPEHSGNLAGERSTPEVVFPGAFNPLHTGHERMAQLAAKRYGTPVTFEISITNVDKPPLDFIELDDRLKQLTGRHVLLTRAATFVEKARLTPNCVFIVGADTLVRIGDTEYYLGDSASCAAAIAEIAERGCRFLVFGRSVEGRFFGLSDLNVPAPLRALCDEVSEAEFHEEISSTELRDAN
jgi:nicotinamide mononucleotide (NMN) deamidase PncC